MNLSRKQLLLTMTLALALCPPAAIVRADSADQGGNLFSDPVLATGAGFEIKRSQLDDAFITYNTSVAANGGSIPDDQRAVVRSNLLQHLIISKILAQKATPEDRAAILKQVDESIDEARKSAPSPTVFDAEIKASGMTLAQVKARACEEQLSKRVLKREISRGITISDAAARSFYDTNQDQFSIPEQVRVSHILISTLDPATRQPLPPDQKRAKEKLARSIRDRALKGEDFAALVKQYSDDTATKDKGGEYKFPRRQMVAEFEAAAFSLRVNQISELVETQYGYHIIKLLERYPARQESFAEVSDKIKEFLTEQQAEKLLPAYLDRIKAEAHVALLDPSTGKPLPAGSGVASGTN